MQTSEPLLPHSDTVPPTTARWVRAAQAGDRAAFGHLLKQHQGALLGTATKLLGSRDDALDVLQEVALTFYQNLDTIDPKRNIGGWLYQVTVRACYRIMRQRPPLDDAPQALSVEAVSATQEQAIANAQLSAVLGRCMGRLSPQERTAFVLRDLEGLDGPAIAEAMQCKATTARGYYFSARKKLAAIISQEHPEWRESIKGAKHDKA